jgi:capsular polysaccharide transport system ATP-binding protein
VGDAAFKSKSETVFLDRMRSASALFVSHSLGQVRKICTAGAVLEGGRITYFDEVEEAIEQHLRNCGR